MRILLLVTVFVTFTFAAVGLLSYGLYSTTLAQIEALRSINASK